MRGGENMTKLEIVGFCSTCSNCANSMPSLYKACNAVSDEAPCVWNQHTVELFNKELDKE